MFKVNNKDQLIIHKPINSEDKNFYIRSSNLYGWDESMIIDDWYFDHSYRFFIVQICGYLYILDSQNWIIYNWPLSQNVQNPIRELLDSILKEDIICDKSKDQLQLFKCLEGGF